VALAGLALLAPPAWPTLQRLLPAPPGLAFLPGRVLEIIGFDRPLQLAPHLIGQGGVA
jgi:hypothetical protein